MARAIHPTGQTSSFPRQKKTIANPGSPYGMNQEPQDKLPGPHAGKHCSPQTQPGTCSGGPGPHGPGELNHLKTTTSSHVPDKARLPLL